MELTLFKASEHQLMGTDEGSGQQAGVPAPLQSTPQRSRVESGRSRALRWKSAVKQHGLGGGGQPTHPVTIHENASLPERSGSGSAGAIRSDHSLLRSTERRLPSWLHVSWPWLPRPHGMQPGGNSWSAAKGSAQPGPSAQENARRVPGEGRDTWTPRWTPDCRVRSDLWISADGMFQPEGCRPESKSLLLP